MTKQSYESGRFLVNISKSVVFRYYFGDGRDLYNERSNPQWEFHDSWETALSFAKKEHKNCVESYASCLEEVPKLRIRGNDYRPEIIRKFDAIVIELKNGKNIHHF